MAESAVLRRVIDELVQLITQEAAPFEEFRDQVAYIKEDLESILDYENPMREEEKEAAAADRIKKVTDEYKDHVAQHHSDDRHGFINTFLRKIQSLVEDLIPSASMTLCTWERPGWSGSFKITFRFMEDFHRASAEYGFEVFNSKLVQKATLFAIEPILSKGEEFIHESETVFYDLMSIAILLAGSSNSDAVVASGILVQHSLCHSKPQHMVLEKKFGKEVANLVKEVSKISMVSEKSDNKHLGNSECWPNLILAMVDDARAIMIKIAELIVKIVALDTLDSEEKQMFVNEALLVYLPLSERLGFNLWKNRLENSYSDANDKLKKFYASVCENDEDGISFKVKLQNALKKKQLPYRSVEYRKKSLRSIQNKMSCKEMDFSEIRDIIGLRIIVKTEEDCYLAKGVVEKLWKSEPKFEKDYIRNPKDDGYKSLHVIVKNKKDQYMEVQIRTEKMHKESNDAHWLYKEGNLQVPEHVKVLVEFARLVNKKETKVIAIEGNSSPHHPACFYAKLDRPPCLDKTTGICKFPGKGPVYVIVKANYKVAIHEHPTGTQLRDVAIKQRPNLGTMRLKDYQLQSKLDRLPLERKWEGRVYVNSKPASLTYTLSAGDYIEFM